MQFLCHSKKVLPLILTAVFIAGCSSKQKVVSYTPSSSSSSSTQVNDSVGMHQATMRPYTVLGKTYYPSTVSTGDTYSGVASWYGKDFHNKKTSNGEAYNMYGLTAAHKTFPMNTIVKVTNTKNNKSIVVRINDRGPFVANRVIDMSYEGAKQLDFISTGTTPVKLEVLGFHGRTTPAGSAKETIVLSDFDVQIGAFLRRDGAVYTANEYNKQSSIYKAMVSEGYLDSNAIFRVWLQGFKSEAEARDFIANGKYQGAFIVREK
ncbi:MAG: septal ring lytic transglycosylase RlpA family protein [Campylobacteraceae bacterium]